MANSLLLEYLFDNVRSTVRFEAADLVESSQQCDMRWLYGVHTGDIQYIYVRFKREVIHNI